MTSNLTKIGNTEFLSHNNTGQTNSPSMSDFQGTQAIYNNVFRSHVPCTDSKWYIFLLSSLTALFGGLLVILLCRMMYYVYITYFAKHYRKVVVDEDADSQRHVSLGFQKISLYARIYKITKLQQIFGKSPNFESTPKLTKARDWCSKTINGQNALGRVLISSVFMLSVLSMMIYAYETNQHPRAVEWCELWMSRKLTIIDFTLNIYFLFFFVIRFIAADNKFWFWLDVYSLVEYCTIPPSFVNIYLHRSWQGLRFLRSLRFMTLPDVLQILGLKNGKHIRLCQLSTIFVSIWMSGAGAFHLLENSEGARITYGNALYYTIVTMSTVGYGDYYPKSVLGKIFIIFFIITSLSIFASYVPEIANILTSRSRYSGNYQKEHGKRHVIVCGDVTTETVDNFLSDFLHKDREENDVEVVFINPHEPDLQMQGLIKRHYTRVEYFIGSVLNPIDLERVKMDSADACLVLANQRCNNPDAEDEANILRVISVKNNCPDVRVVMQILQYHNKGHLFNIPYWNSDRGDDIVCFAELKMGFMAQSCLAPGFSTVISNLFSMRSEMDDNDRLVNWQTLYLRGVAMEIYSDKFSSAFNGMTFTEAALLCKNKLDLLLLAIEVIHPDTDTHFLAINPGPQYRLNEGYLGFFICDTQEQARRAKVFCLKCHSDVRNPHEIKLCSCPLKTKQTVKTYVESAEDLTDQDSVYEQANFEERCHKEITLRVQSANFHRKLNEQDLKHSGPKLFDITGMYHWCEPREFLDACFTSGDDPTFKTLKGHVIVCIFADGRSPLVNLRNFVMPLRASNLDYEELKPIVFLGNSEFLAREWEWMKTFPMVYLMCGSPMSRVLLRSARIDTCGMCVIISAKSELSSKEDPYCIDKEVILCSLNIKSLDFNSKSFIGELFGPGGFASQLCLSDGRMAGSEFNIKSDEISHLSPTVPLLTELHVDGNLQFLDEDDDDAPGMEVYMTQPFACGTAFTESVLDSLVSTAYFNRNALTLIRTLVTGGATPELEKILAEDIGFVGSPVTEEVTNNRCRSRIEQLSMQDSRMSELTLPTTFGKLFNFCLERHSILCLALYRYQDLDSLPVGKDPRRYVLTSPENNFKVAANDLVICVTIFKESGEAAMDKITVPKVNLPKQERPTNQNDLTTLTINTTKC